MIGRLARQRRSAAIRDGPFSASQLDRTCGAHFTAMRALQNGGSRFVAGGANRAPAGPRGNRRELPPLIGVGIDQEQRPEDYFFAHGRSFSANE
jgi:hypothetical protein